MFKDGEVFAVGKMNVQNFFYYIFAQANWGRDVIVGGSSRRLLQENIASLSAAVERDVD